VKGGGAKLDEERAIWTQCCCVNLARKEEARIVSYQRSKEKLPEQSKIQHIQGNGFFFNDGDRIG
jgi:hypothetical protein